MDDPELKNILKEDLALSKENNQMLHAMRRSQRIARVMTLVYWLFIIGSAVGAYYFIQPYFEQVIGAYNSASGVLKDFGN